MKDYSRIIDHPHYQSKTHPHMSMEDRAVQFAPFAALTGYSEAVAETGRLTEERVVLSEDVIAEIDQTLRFAIMAHVPVAVTCFVPDENKEGGSYQTHTGFIRKKSGFGNDITLENGSVIKKEDITYAELLDNCSFNSPAGEM